MSRNVSLLTAVALLSLACTRAAEQSPPPAPKGETLAAPSAKTTKGVPLTVAADSGAATFTMQAPLERQDAEVGPGAVSGTLYLDPTDLTQTTGLVRVDLTDLTIYQRAREDEESEFGEREKSDLQNEHMRDWLEIAEDAPEAEREKNRYAEFALQDVKNESVRNIGSLSGTERRVTFMAVGELRVHQRAVPKEIAMEATFHVDGQRLTAVEVSTTTPFLVDLERHDIRPRSAFGTLAQKTLQAMAPKVASKAVVHVEFKALPDRPVEIAHADSSHPLPAPVATREFETIDEATPARAIKKLRDEGS